MFYLNKSIELSCQLLTKMINRFYTTVEPKLITYGNYYNGLQAILQKTYSDPTKPCSRTVVNYCKNIVDSYCGYMVQTDRYKSCGEQLANHYNNYYK